MPDKNITYEALAPQLKTGDIVIMRGNSRFQQVLEVLTESPYVHSAMVVLSKDIGMKDDAAPILLWESTAYMITEDQKLHKPKAGPTLTDLKTRLNDELSGNHFNAFVFRLLNRPQGPQQLEGLKKAIRTSTLTSSQQTSGSLSRVFWDDCSTGKCSPRVFSVPNWWPTVTRRWVYWASSIRRIFTNPKTSPKKVIYTC
jgi:hypothetical protein